MGRAARDPDAMPSEEPEVLGQIRMATPVEKLDAPVSEGEVGIALIGEGDLATQNTAGEAVMRPPLNDPKDLYERALADLRSGAYSGAQTDFEQMLTRFPAHKLSGNAQYWLGETFYVRRQFKQAAEAFLAGYTTYQQSTKAPDSLLKLGMTLAAMGEKKTSCDAFKELAVKFPQAPQAITKRAQIEKSRVGCAS
jgi:tol-pal system protein YbgF